MALLDPQDIRSRIAASIASVLGGSGYYETRDPPPLFPDGPSQQQANRHLRHKGYSVFLGQTIELSSEGRQTPSVGVWSRTIVHVVFGYRLRAGAAVADYDAALDVEKAVIAAVVATAKNPALHPRLMQVAQRAVTADGELYVGRIDFSVLHHMPIA